MPQIALRATIQRAWLLGSPGSCFAKGWLSVDALDHAGWLAHSRARACLRCLLPRALGIFGTLSSNTAAISAQATGITERAVVGMVL